MLTGSSGRSSSALGDRERRKAGLSAVGRSELDLTVETKALKEGGTWACDCAARDI